MMISQWFVSCLIQDEATKQRPEFASEMVPGDGRYYLELVFSMNKPKLTPKDLKSHRIRVRND